MLEKCDGTGSHGEADGQGGPFVLPRESSLAQLLPSWPALPALGGEGWVSRSWKRAPSLESLSGNRTASVTTRPTTVLTSCGRAMWRSRVLGKGPVGF
jgi:hypothetical protein